MRVQLFVVLMLAAATAAGGWREAQVAFDAQRWQEAARLLEEIARENPRDVQAELRLATALLNLRRFDDAAAHLERAKSLGAGPGALAYRRATLFSQTGHRDEAFAELDAALTAGLGPASRPADDALLAPLHGDARFAAFLERYERAVFPCRRDARYRAFDFWIGTWDVRPSIVPGSSDAPASENVITLEHGDCVVIEHWRSLAGGTGTSLNIYDASRGMWFQTWADGGGGLHEYRGNPDERGNMIFAGETPGSAGQPARLPTRLTFFREGPDRVRQFSQSSVDEGKTWTTNYELIYTRRKDSR